MKLKLKLKHNRELVASAGLVALGLLIGVAGLLLGILPQQSKAKQLDDQIAKAQSQLISLHGARGPVIRAADLFQLARAMPDDEDMPGILVNLQHAADRAGVTITSVQPSDGVAQADGSFAIPLKVILTGGWPGVTMFLRTLREQVQVDRNGSRLTSAGRLFVIDSIDLSGGTGAVGDKSQPEITATLSLNAFMYGSAPPPPTTTGTTTTTTTTPAPPASVSAESAPTGSAG